MRLPGALRRMHAEERGQSVVLVALSFTLLLGFAGAAIDLGRYYAERRFLQSAVDAAALGCAQKLIVGGTQAQAEDQGETILSSYNLASDPTGTAVSVNPSPQRNTWFNGDPNDWRNLYDGVYAGTTDCRAAVQASMQTWFLRLFGQPVLSVPANAHAAAKGGMLPVVVNRYKDPPGPSTTFIDYAKQEAYQTATPNVCYENGGRVGGGTCPEPAESPIDCMTGCLWGPETVIVGQGYQSSDSDFRGFIALDIRDFTSASHLYYNGVTSGMNTNSLKDQEASYINGGYPGPDLETYVPDSSPVQPGLQIATMSGNSSGVVVSNFQKYFRQGDKVLVQLFDGQVREIPDFTINAPSVISAVSPSGPADGPTFRVGSNQRFREPPESPHWVHLEMVRDEFNSPTESDTPSGLTPAFTFSTNDFTPGGGAGTSVTIRDLQVAAGVPSGIYSVVIKGTGHQWPIPSGTVSSTHQAWVPVKIGTVQRDFATEFSATTAEVCNAAGCSPLDTEAVFTFTLTTGASAQAWQGGAVTVAADRGSTPCGVNQVQLTLPVSPFVLCRDITITASPDFVPKKNGPPTVTVRIPVTGLATGAYKFVLRARGMNGESPTSQPVVHVTELVLNVNTSGGGATRYINVQGYSVFLITSVDQNTVKGRAISGYYADPKDPALNVAHRAGLLPWEAAPY